MVLNQEEFSLDGTLLSRKAMPSDAYKPAGHLPQTHRLSLDSIWTIESPRQSVISFE